MFSADLGVTPTAANYIEDVFSTYLYTGNGSTQTITNGIDLSGKGGLVWLKNRTGTYDHWLWDTARGAGYALKSNTTAASANIGTTEGVSFSSTGFSFGNNINWNESGTTAASWTFRKQAKFFDVVTYTGNGTSQNIAHSLGSVPGCIIVKCTSAANDWRVYHRSLATVDSALRLNSTAAAGSSSTFWNSTAPTSTQFSIGSDGSVNSSGATYVAYLFAHDAGGFGAAGTDNVISCGSFTGTSKITLGYEPQFVLMKQSNAAGSWYLYDTMRGIVADPSVNSEPYLLANLSNAEATGQNYIGIDATGFTPSSAAVGPSDTFIYIAIRRGPMKTPTSGTSVFSPIASSAATGTTLTTSFPVDAQIFSLRSGTTNKNNTYDRLRGVSSTTTESGARLITSSTAAETAAGNETRLWDNTSFQMPSTFGGASTVFWNFRRAPGFFDVVCYTGNGDNTNGITISHNLGVAPQTIICKRRDTTANWFTSWAPILGYGTNNEGYLNLTDAFINGGKLANAPTATTFKWTDANGLINASGGTYVAYLFATVAGVSKVGSYTGTGTTKQIDCGFTGGARFVLIKRTDSTGDWYVWDSARGIVAGNDPYLLLNSTAAEVTTTDYVDTYSAGFEISSTAPAAINANGGSFIFLAIA